MATKLENIDLEIAHFNNFKQYIPGFDKCDPATVEHLLKLGIIQSSTAFEHALSTILGCTVVSEDANDLSNGGDGKTSSVRTYGYGKSYGAPITNISGKSGTLYIQVYERKKDQFYYFSIPNSAYSHIPKTSNIEIPFETDGTPRRINRSNVNWWNYEVNSLEDFKNTLINHQDKKRTKFYTKAGYMMLLDSALWEIPD
jgi:hypothetical protein